MTRPRNPSRSFVAVLLLTLVAGCAGRKLTPGEGYAAVPGGRVWYRVVGTGTRTPLLLIHGGPGVPSDYLKPLEALGDDRPVIFYDQLGTGRSDQPTDTTLWRTERFVEEVGALRKALGLEKVHVLGHSWGTIVGAEYALTQPAGLRSLILASPALDIPLWERNADSLRRTLPDSIQQMIVRHEQDGTYDSPEYQGAMMAFYAQYICRRNPWPAEVDSSFVNMNQTLYRYMQGPSEFTITGTLKGYDLSPRLGGIAVPTLFTVGEYDEALPSSAAHFASLIPGAKLAIVPDAAHLTMQDQPDEYIRVVRAFLRDVEGE